MSGLGRGSSVEHRLSGMGEAATALAGRYGTGASPRNDFEIGTTVVTHAEGDGHLQQRKKNHKPVPLDAHPLVISSRLIWEGVRPDRENG